MSDTKHYGKVFSFSFGEWMFAEGCGGKSQYPPSFPAAESKPVFASSLRYYIDKPCWNINEGSTVQTLLDRLEIEARMYAIKTVTLSCKAHSIGLDCTIGDVLNMLE